MSEPVTVYSKFSHRSTTSQTFQYLSKFALTEGDWDIEIGVNTSGSGVIALASDADGVVHPVSRFVFGKHKEVLMQAVVPVRHPRRVPLQEFTEGVFEKGPRQPYTKIFYVCVRAHQGTFNLHTYTVAAMRM